MEEGLLRKQVANLVYFCTTKKRRINELQKELVGSLSFSISALFRSIARSGHGHITFNDMEQLFRCFNKSLAQDDFLFLSNYTPRRAKRSSNKETLQPFVTYEQFLDMIRPINIPVFQLRVASASTKSLYEHVPEAALESTANILDAWIFFYSIKRLLKDKLQAEYGFYCPRAFSGMFKVTMGIGFSGLKDFMNRNDFVFDEFDFKLLLDDMNLMSGHNIKISQADFFKYLSPEEISEEKNYKCRHMEKGGQFVPEKSSFATALRSNVPSAGILGPDSSFKPIDCGMLMAFQSLGDKYTMGKYGNVRKEQRQRKANGTDNSLFTLPPSCSPSEMMNPLNQLLISSISSSIKSRNNRPFIDPMEQAATSKETNFDRCLSNYYRQLGLREKMNMYSKMVGEEQERNRQRGYFESESDLSSAKFYRDQFLMMHLDDVVGRDSKLNEEKRRMKPAPMKEETSECDEDLLVQYFRKKESKDLNGSGKGGFEEASKRNESGWFKENGYDSVLMSNESRTRNETPVQEIDLREFSEINLTH